VNTRPDITFVVGFVRRFMQEPHVDHLVVVKHILRYLAGTSSVGLFYPKRGSDEPVLMGYSDSGLAIEKQVGYTSTTYTVSPKNTCE
jgi:hypothetical protein